MAKKRGLAANRGLDALLGSIKKEKQITATALQGEALRHDHDSQEALPEAETNPRQLRSPKAAKPTKKPVEMGDDQVSLIQIDVERLQAGKYQPRRDMSETALSELAASIEQHGIMQPIVIRPLLATEDKSRDDVTHEIIAGERRWRAAKMAGKKDIPAIERALSDELAIALALIENIQREDLSVIEQAAALQRFHTEFGMSHAMIADVVGKARTTVSNLLRLNQLHDTVKDHLATSALDMGHARTLLALSLEQQPIIAQKIIDGGMTVREAERLVKSILQPEPKTTPAKAARNRDTERLIERLTETLGAEVKLKHKKDGQGSVEIFFQSADELAALIEHLGVTG